MKFSIKDFFRKLRIWSHLLKKSLMGNFIFCVVKQTSFTEKQCQKLDDTYEFDKIIKKEKPIFTKYNRSNLIYNIKYYIEYYNITNFNSLSLTSKYPILLSLYSDLNKFNNLNPHKESTKEKKATVHENTSEIYNEYLEIYFNEYKALLDAQTKKLGKKYDPINLFLETYTYDV